MRNLLELYQLFLERFKEINIDFVIKGNNFLCNGLHNLLENNLVNKEEYDMLKEHLMSQKPSNEKHISFYEHELYLGTYCWFNSAKNEKLTYALRVQLLTNIIADLKDASNQ
jgi:hypothetical protein